MKKIYFSHIRGNIHPVYQEMLAHPPEGIVYINKDDFGYNYQKNIQLATKNKVLQKLKEVLKKFYILPNIRYTQIQADLIYSCQAIQFFGDYVLDLDCYEALNRFSNKISSNDINKSFVRFFLRRKNCKKILFWSENAKIGFQGYFGHEFDNKIEVVSPALLVKHDLETLSSWKDRKTKHILFVGRYFERKGGIIALEVFHKIVKIYPDIRFDIISQVSLDLQEQYKHPYIHFHGLLEREKVKEYFKKADIFLMPTLHEVFGFVFLEAFAYGAIPISLDTFAVNNIISDDEDGYVIGYEKKFHKTEYHYIDKYNQNIDSLISEITITEQDLIEEKILHILKKLLFDNSLIYSLRHTGFKKVKEGRFSMDVRRDKFKKIFNGI